MCKKIVKKHRLYWVLLFAFLSGSAAKADVNNYVGAYGFLGEWSLMPSQSKYQTSFGVAGGAGFLYELQAGDTYKPTRFLLDIGVGAWGGMTSFGQSSNQTVELLNQRDLQGDPFDYVYEIKDRRDQYNDLAVQVPILIGVHHRKFYMLAGAKINAHVLTKAHTTANITTFGRYEAIPDLRNMPDYQFFNDQPLKGSTNAKLNLDVAVSLEIGGRLGVINEAVGYDVPKRKTEYRLAAFVDYGLMDMHTNGTQQALGVVDPANPSQVLPFENGSGGYNINYNIGSTYPVYNTTSMVDNVVMNDIMSTSGFAKSVNSLMIGLKFTILFQLPKPGTCVICRDAYRSTIRPRSGRLKYEE